MASNKVKYLLVENTRLQSLVAKLAGTVETIHCQLKEKEDALAKRRIEVATLHQACAKYKLARAVLWEKKTTRLANLSPLWLREIAETRRNVNGSRNKKPKKENALERFRDRLRAYMHTQKKWVLGIEWVTQKKWVFGYEYRKQW